MKKVLFFDIDGTLIDVGNGITDIPEGAKRQMRKLQKQGHLLFIATGRPYAFISEVINDFGFDGMVLSNGAHVELNGKTIYQQPTDVDITLDLLKHLDENHFEYVIETARKSYLKPEFKVLDDFFHYCRVNQDYIIRDFKVEDVIDQCLKLELNVPDDRLDEVEQIIKDKFKYDRNGNVNAFEVYSKVISKATGIKKVLEYLNLDISDSYGFGDGLNDLEMIQTVGTGVAMGNGADKLKEVSDLVCDSVLNNGLEKVLIELFG